METVHSIIPDRSDDLFDSAACMLASGMPLREGVDLIINAQSGALICIGDVENVLLLANGGFKIDSPFTPQRLFELSKMDGAIVLTEDLKQIVYANLHLNPDPGIFTNETGMRHRSAARTSTQTKATVIAISKRRVQTTLYRDGKGLTLESDAMILSKSNQGLLALQNLKNTLERSMMRLSFLELDDIATVTDVITALRRYCNLLTIAVETERYINFLGEDSGLLRYQLEEIVGGMVDSFVLTIRDYAMSSDLEDARVIARALLKLSPLQHDAHHIMSLLGFKREYADEDHISPRGFRAISRISMLDEVAVSKIIEEYGSLSEIVRDSKDGFDRLENLNVDNVRAIAKSFMQLRSTL